MKISVLTLFPDLYKPFFSTSLIKKAQEKGLLSVEVKDFFSYVAPKERIDSPIVGHGSGMLVKPEVVEKAIEEQDAQHGKSFKIFFSPQGKKLDQVLAAQLAQKLTAYEHVTLVASRYEGIDQRVETFYADEVISIGDYVLMGGDLPAMVLLESVLRFFPGVVGKEESVQKDSFMGPFVDFPSYTTPVEWKGFKIPDILRSGNHGAVDAYREEHAIQKSVIAHFEWVRSYPLSPEQVKKVAKKIPKHYVVLMHSQVSVNGLIGNSSVTSLDMHDIARSSSTYGLENYFIVTPLKDQKQIVNTLLDFWQTDVGLNYNPHRHESIRKVVLKDTIEEVIEFIAQKERKKPLVISTSAKEQAPEKAITYFDQQKVWSQDRPVLLVLGTGQGLSQEFIDSCDYLLLPINGFSSYNHLSVRSAAAIIFDRWLGRNRKF